MLAEEPLPEAERYDGYPQLENGVGMLRLQEEEFREALQDVRDKIERGDIVLPIQPRQVSVATGLLACDHVRDMARRLMALCPGLTIWVYPIRNDFFGELITVSGLLTGGDLKNQLLGKELGEGLYLPENVLRSGEAVFLDDMTPAQLGNALQTEVNIVKSSGRDFVWNMLGM